MQEMCGSHHTSFYILQTEYKVDSTAVSEHCDIHEGGFIAGYAFWDCVSLSWFNLVKYLERHINDWCDVRRNLCSLISKSSFLPQFWWHTLKTWHSIYGESELRSKSKPVSVKEMNRVYSVCIFQPAGCCSNEQRHYCLCRSEHLKLLQWFKW